MKTPLTKPSSALKKKASTRVARRRAAPQKAFIRIQVDASLKKKAEGLFNNLGLDTPTAIRIFLDQAIRSRGLPFEVNEFNAETVEALQEAERISRDPNTKSYADFSELLNEVLGEMKNEV